MKLVKAKVKAGKATEITEDFDEVSAGRSAEVVDLMPLLRKSLESKKSRSTAKTHRKSI